MKAIFERLKSNMSLNIIGAIILLLALLGVISGAVGLAGFTRAFKLEYSTTTYHMADTATTLVNGDHLDEFLAGEEKEEYIRSFRALERYCKKISVSLIYVIQVDRSDYGRFISIFNCVDNSVDDTSYIVWELGHERNTTNEEYRSKYKEIYENGSPYETIYWTEATNGLHPHITTMVPVKDSRGAVAGLLCMQRPIRELDDARRPYVRNIAVSTLLLAGVVSVLAAIFIRKNLLDPIITVSDEATRFARENTKGKELGQISRYSEIAGLAESIDTMETNMVSYIDNLTRVTAERERITAELELARTIQENAIPNVFPAFPDRTDFDIHAVMDPAREVGGDFYNFFMIDDDHLALVMGDVSGKGIPAALFMMLTNNQISDKAHMGGTPAEILTKANQVICERNTAEMFVTVWLGILELSTGKLIAANAGHEFPALKRPGGDFELFKDKHGLVIGALEDIRYKDYELTLEPGTKLFVYTDGVPEATDAQEKMLGMDGMVKALNRSPEGGPEQILKDVQDAVDEFVKDAEQFDDLTMLCLEYRGGVPS